MPKVVHVVIDVAVAAVALAVIYTLSTTTIPGVDPMAAYGFSEWVLTIQFGSLAGLVIFRAVGDMFSMGRSAAIARRLALLGFLVGTGAMAWAEGLALSNLQVGPMGIVLEPGLMFQLLFTLTFTGLAALVWWASERLDHLGIDGAATLFALQLVAQFGVYHGDLLTAAQGGVPDVWGIATSGLLPLAVVAGMLTAKRPSWPLRVGMGLHIRTPLPLLVAPWVVADLMPIAPTVGVWIGVVASAVVIFTSESGRRRAWWPVLSLALVASWLGALITTLLLPTAASVDFPGGAHVTAQATYDTPVTPQDVEVIDQRLAAAGVTAELDAQGSTLNITLHHVDGPLAVIFLDEATKPGHLSLHRVVSRRDLPWSGPADAPLHADPTTFPPTPEDTLARVDACYRPPCAVLLLRPAAMHGALVKDAMVSFDNMTQMPHVAVEFTPDAAEAFWQLTRDSVQERIAIVLDDRVLSAPTVREAISGGRVVINAGGDSPDALADASSLARTLRTPPMPAAHRTAFAVLKEW